MNEGLMTLSVQDRINNYVFGLLKGTDKKNTVAAAITSAQSLEEIKPYQTSSQSEIYHLTLTGIEGDFPQAELRILTYPLKSEWAVHFIMQEKTPIPGVNFGESPDNEVVLAWRGKIGEESDTLFVHYIGLRKITFNFTNNLVQIASWEGRNELAANLNDQELNNRLKELPEGGVRFSDINLAKGMLVFSYSGFLKPENIARIQVPQKISF